MHFCFFFSSRRRHTRCALVTGVQTCALPISMRIGGQPPGDVLRLAEGFEEAVSVSQLSAGKFKVWGAGGIRRYGLIAIPERIRKIVIYSQHGQEAAQAIEDARGHLTANDRELKIILPPAPAPMDWNDILQEKARC